MEKSIEVFHAFDDDDGGSQDDTRPDLGETADMVEGTIDDKDEIVGEALTCNEVLCIGNNRAVTDHHPFRFTCRTRCIKHVGNTFRNAV